MTFSWEQNPDISALVTRLWQDGETASQICRHIGRDDITRNSIIGRVNRLKLVRHSQRQISSAPAKKKKPVSARKTVPIPPTPLPAPPPDAPKPVIPPETYAGHGGCQFITGHPSEPKWQMCGNPVLPDKKYCAYHHPKCVDLVRTAQVRRAQH